MGSGLASSLCLKGLLFESWLLKLQNQNRGLVFKEQITWGDRRQRFKQQTVVQDRVGQMLSRDASSVLAGVPGGLTQESLGWRP